MSEAREVAMKTACNSTERKSTAHKSTARKPSARKVMRDLLRDGGVRDVDTIVDGLDPFLRTADAAPGGGGTFGF
jgi:hypothetical protein